MTCGLDAVLITNASVNLSRPYKSNQTLTLQFSKVYKVVPKEEWKGRNEMHQKTLSAITILIMKVSTQEQRESWHH